MKNINQLRLLIVFAIIGVCVYIIYSLPLTLGLDLQGGTRLIFQAEETKEVKINDDSMAGVVAVIRNRIDALGVSEPIIQRKGRNQVVVELPGIKDIDHAIEIIGDTAMLEFVEAEWAPGDISVIDKDRVTAIYGKDARVQKFKSVRNGKVLSEHTIILKKSALTGAELKGVWPGVDQYGNPVVDIEFNPKGTQLFAEVTARSVGKPLAIILDDKIISAPNVREPIPSGRAQISGDFEIEEVSDLVIKLKAGALPVPIELIASSVVGPTLGRDSIDKSVFAGLLGFALVVAFMILYYRLPGFLSGIALIIYVLISFSVFALFKLFGFGFVLTLPGIAGFLLSIGMAVDANILIFERLKEELRLGKTIKASLEAAFSRAFSAILDANITTIFAAGTLFWVGTGTIRGFGLTLTIGILASMFTAIIITRMLLNMAVDCKIISGANSKLVYK